jgi:hypothetical protein
MITLALNGHHFAGMNKKRGSSKAPLRQNRKYNNLENPSRWGTTNARRLLVGQQALTTIIGE